MNDQNKQDHGWKKFFDSDGIKSNLVRTSLYLFSYELLKNSIVDKIKDFYMVGFDANEYIYSEDYNKKVVNRKIKGKQNIYLSSLLWLEESGAISKYDVEELSNLREYRNTVAHNVDRILTDSDFNLDITKEQRIFEFIRQIELWWIREVEIPTNPDYDGSEINDDEIISGKEVFYTYIKNISDELLKK